MRTLPELFVLTESVGWVTAPRERRPKSLDSACIRDVESNGKILFKPPGEICGNVLKQHVAAAAIGGAQKLCGLSCVVAGQSRGSHVRNVAMQGSETFQQKPIGKL